MTKATNTNKGNKTITKENKGGNTMNNNIILTTEKFNNMTSEEFKNYLANITTKTKVSKKKVDIVYMMTNFNAHYNTKAIIEMLTDNNINLRKSLTSDCTYYVMKNDEVYCAIQIHDTRKHITIFSRKASINNKIFDIVIGENERRRKAEVTPSEFIEFMKTAR